MTSCSLCSYPANLFAENSKRAYFKCPRCDLIFASPTSRLDITTEKLRYDQHENDPKDLRYRNFLNRVAQPLLRKLTPGMHGLDYGCGPGPTLSVMLEEAGMVMALYDPYYANDSSALLKQYDFVTCTEVVEHFHCPAEDWQQLVTLLRPGGWLGVMTTLVDLEVDFLDWYYQGELTHVSFYSVATFSWLGAHFQLAVEQVDTNVVLFQRS